MKLLNKTENGHAVNGESFSNKTLENMYRGNFDSRFVLFCKQTQWRFFAGCSYLAVQIRENREKKKKKLSGTSSLYDNTALSLRYPLLFAWNIQTHAEKKDMKDTRQTKTLAQNQAAEPFFE